MMCMHINIVHVRNEFNINIVYVITVTGICRDDDQIVVIKKPSIIVIFIAVDRFNNGN
jgi:hypothetical protein